MSASHQSIDIKNCRVNNLKNISLTIPKNKLTVITGLSGSGKSSLAFDTIYAEGQRRYAESLNAYARQFMDVQDKPDVDEINGLSPTIAIDQKNISRNPRSTVGTTTEIYDFLRLLFSRLGVQYCPDTNEPAYQYTAGEITEKVREHARDHGELLILAPMIKDEHVKGKEIKKRFGKIDYEMVRINGITMHVRKIKGFKFNPEHTYDIDVIVGRLSDVKKEQVADLVDRALDLANGTIGISAEETGDEWTYTTFPYCAASEKTFDPVESRTFSFNSPYGACPRCTGLGYTMDIDPELVIPNPRLTLAEGAIQPWTRIVGNQNQYRKLLEAVAKTHNFSVDKPIKDLSKRVMDILMYGTDGEVYLVDGKKEQFEGVIPNLTQRHAETTSDYIRKEIEQYMREGTCPVCAGRRLKQNSLSVKIADYAISDFVEMSIEEFYTLAQAYQGGTGTLYQYFSDKNKAIADPIMKEVTVRLHNLINVGLGYLTLDRAMNTLSGGESQRIRLSSQLSTGLTDVIYILDEPSIGLHPKDNEKLIGTLTDLRDLGNTVIVVEHDAAMMESADHIIDIGPGAGFYGGEIVAMGTAEDIKNDKDSLTGAYLSDKKEIALPKKYRKGSGKKITIESATEHNLKNIDVTIPLGTFISVTGVSGSGKSTLISKILGRSLRKHFFRAKSEPGAHKKISGIDHIDKVIAIDQNPIGRTPRSNPATYTGVFTAIRDLFTEVPEAKMRGYSAGMFSFNVKGGGRCEACSGEGYIRIPMQFLTDVFVECGECNGKRYNQEALEIRYRQKTIADVLEMTIEEAHRFFNDTPAIAEKLRVLCDVGLGYIHLGQPATTLSGGEAQRIKLATELSRRSTGQTLYILDEPTTGLHFEDIKRLLHVLQKLVDKGNTVLTIEHNLDVIKSADWIIDLGPEGGKKGGEVVAQGTPPEVAKVKESWTGRYLKELI